MDSMIFTQAIPRLRVLETKLLDKPKFDRTIDSNSIKEVLKVLQETEYGVFISKLKKPEDYEQILKQELIRIYNVMYEISPKDSIVDIMSLKYDYHNLKVLIKAKKLSVDLSSMLIPIGTQKLNVLKYAVDNENFRQLSNTMKSALEESLKNFTETKDPQYLDVILDKYTIKEMIKLSAKINNKFLDKYIKTLIDLNNIKSLLRVKKQNRSKNFLKSILIEGGKVDTNKISSLLNDSNDNIISKLSYTDYSEILKTGIETFKNTGSISYFEILSDNYIMNLIKDAKYITFGLEPVIAYIYAKETEIKNIRIVLVGKLNKVAKEAIRERLRDIYV